MSFSAGLVFYNSKKELERCLPTIPKHWKIIAVDGRYKDLPSESPLSTDGSRELIQSYPNTILLDAPDMIKHEKRNIYLRNCDTDFMLMIDSDEWITGDIPLFEKVCKERATDDFHIYNVPVEMDTIPDTFEYRPRLWYKPYEMEYIKTHWTWHRIGDDRAWWLTGTPHTIPMYGIDILHNHSLRSPDTERKWLKYRRETISKESRHNMWNLKNEDEELARIAKEELGMSAEALGKIVERKKVRDARQYYQNFIADDIVYPLNEKLVEVVKSYNPESVFEFGCGVGKNLKLLGIERAFGMDISKKAVNKAIAAGVVAYEGDEETLSNLQTEYDIAFTCSVLDHIPDIDGVVPELKRLAKKAVVIAETTDKVGSYCYPHDYESFGFKKLDYSWLSPFSGAEYHIWVMEQ